MIAQLFGVIAPLIACSALGYGWAKTGQSFDTRGIAALVSNIGLPCLAFTTLVTATIDSRAASELAIAAALALLAFLGIGLVILRSVGLPAHTYLPVVALPNAGNMGLPVCLFAFGELGLAYGIVWAIIAALMHYTFGVWIASGRGSPGFLVRTPLVYAIAIAFAFVLTDAAPPGWVLDTTHLLGGVTIPLMLVTLGVSLARPTTVRLGRGLALALARLAMGFGVGLGLAELFGLHGIARGVMIIESAMPAAVFNYILAERYARAPSEIAGIVVLSTLLSYATLPLLLLVVL